MYIDYDGNFRGQTGDGDYILYPYFSSSDLTFRIGGTDYSVDSHSIDPYRTSDTYVNPNDPDEAITEWEINGVQFEQQIRLEEDHVVFFIAAKNTQPTPKQFSVRYLWDTQLCDNDGSPLKAEGTLYTTEMGFEPVDFNYWSAYSRPEESSAELVTYAYWLDKPDKIIFAHWPGATQTEYDYAWSPTRQFYTPGYVTSPYSDSCVLMYWEDIDLPANGQETITVYYGSSEQTGLTLSLRLDQAEYKPGEFMNIFATVEDGDGNQNYPMHVGNTEVTIDGVVVTIAQVVQQLSGEYLIQVPAPEQIGTHTVEVRFVTEQSSAGDSVNFEVIECPYTGTVDVSETLGTVDEATKDWGYRTNYNAPVFRRKMDIPHFSLTLDQTVPLNYLAYFEVFSPLDDDNPIGSCESTFDNPDDRLIGLWRWKDTDGQELALQDVPVGIYRVDGYLIDSTDESVRQYIGSAEFFVIFEFDEDMKSFVAMDKEIDYMKQIFGSFKIHDIYSLHLYDDPRIFNLAINSANGARTVLEAVESISHLARNIDGNMVYHHAWDNEQGIFLIDGYDNDFDGTIDELTGPADDEAWNHDYHTYWDRAMSPLSGKAYERDNGDGFWYATINGKWVDDDGGYHYSILSADRMAWYFDIQDMLDKDFDPEGQIDAPHKHSVGVCEDYAMLSVGYLRAIGVPSRVIGSMIPAGGHAFSQFYNTDGDGDWPSLLDKWRHFDPDYNAVRTQWEQDKFDWNKYGCISWASARTNSGVIDVSPMYNLGRTCAVNEMMEALSVCEYDLANSPLLSLGDPADFDVNITNNGAEEVSVNVTLQLITSQMPLGGTAMPLSSVTELVTVPAGSMVTRTFTLPVPGDTTSGEYNLEIYEEDELVLQNPYQISAEFSFSTDWPPVINYGEPFDLTLTVRNTGAEEINDIFTMVDLHSYFDTTDALIQDCAMLGVGDEMTFTWTLTPTYYGDLRIDASVYTSDAGSDFVILDVPVNEPTDLWINAEVPDAVESGDDFTLTATVSNSGDLIATDVMVELTLPGGVTADPEWMDLGDIPAHGSAPAVFTISQDLVHDFTILLTATSSETTAQGAAVVNIVEPDVFVDFLYEDEVPGATPHQGIIEATLGEECAITLYINNTGEKDLTNVEVSTNVGTVQSLGTLPVGASAEIPSNFVPTIPGLGEVNATVTSDELQTEYSRTLMVEQFDFSVSTPNERYLPGDTIPVTISVTNQVPDVRFIDLEVNLTLQGNSYQQSIDIPLLSLAPLETKERIFSWDTTGLPMGVYNVDATLIMAEAPIMDEMVDIYLGTSSGPTTPPPPHNDRDFIGAVEEDSTNDNSLAEPTEEPTANVEPTATEEIGQETAAATPALMQSGDEETEAPTTTASPLIFAPALAIGAIPLLRRRK